MYFNAMSLLHSLFFIFLGMLSCLPSLLTWQLFNLWLSDLGHSAAFIASLSLIGLPHYFKSFFIPYLECCQPPAVHSNRWLNWMIYACFFSGLFTLILGQCVPDMNFTTLALTGAALNISGIIFEKSSYVFQLLSFKDTERGDAIWSHNVGQRMGHGFGEIAALVLAHYYGWIWVYYCFSIFFLGTTCALFFVPSAVLGEHQTNTAPPSAPINYYHLAHSHASFLVVCFIVNAGDQMTRWFLTLYLRNLGLSYMEIAMLGKSWGLVCFIIGAMIGRWIWKRSNSLFFWAMMSCFLHGLALLPLMYATSFKHALIWIFFFKNITLGLKKILITALISEYLRSTKHPVGLYFLSSISRSLMIFVISLSGPIMTYNPNLIFIIAGCMSMPAMIALHRWQLQWPSKSEVSSKSSGNANSSISSITSSF